MNNERPPITIVVTTYFPDGAEARIATALRTLASWREHLRYEGEIKIEICDDDSPEDMSLLFRRGLESDPPGYWREWRCSGSTHLRAGVGSSLNSGIATCKASGSLMLYAVDDWRIDAPFDLTPWADVLIENSTVGCVRFFPHPHLRGGRILNFRTGWAVEFERVGFYWAQRPALYHMRFFDYYGGFPENVSALDVDEIYNANICHAHPMSPKVILALPQAWTPDESDTVPLGHLVPERR